MRKTVRIIQSKTGAFQIRGKHGGTIFSGLEEECFEFIWNNFRANYEDHVAMLPVQHVASEEELLEMTRLVRVLRDARGVYRTHRRPSGGQIGMGKSIDETLQNTYKKLRQKGENWRQVAFLTPASQQQAADASGTMTIVDLPDTDEEMDPPDSPLDGASDNLELQYGSDEEESKHDNSDGEQENIDMDQVDMDEGIDGGDAQGQVEQQGDIQVVAQIDEELPIRGMNNDVNDGNIQIIRTKRYKKYVYIVRNALGEIVPFKTKQEALNYANQVQQA
ncbi:Aste57867_16757 [Aphanomyces stellatus]|uniref:Aste57867_16757 protein n=1 Tax=Aphanomyces stellatus TaxID=120398 RepID=A0A485L6B1_9STRA|nr:hypothetical protein As57867_016700 [Aphanomyces stellatus]VFT93523.1 Aste57867_16757 [Aphanomyces stellatus]